MSEEENISNQKSEEKPEDKTQSQPQSQTSNLPARQAAVKPQTKTMETHAHHLHKAPGRGWRHYFFEFFMLFLAVFCGFLAENQREHIVERKREKQYMQNLLQDLERDSTALAREIDLRNRKSMRADSLILELDSAEKIRNTANIYLHTYYLTSLRSFGYSNVTIEQLKNSGSMRLIREKRVADSITSYDIEVQQYKIREEGERELLPEYRKAICFLLDARIMLDMEDPISPNIYHKPETNVPLLTKDPATINLIKGLAAQIHTRNEVLTKWLKILLRKNDTLLELLKKEYRLK